MIYFGSMLQVMTTLNTRGRDLDDPHPMEEDDMIEDCKLYF